MTDEQELEKIVMGLHFALIEVERDVLVSELTTKELKEIASFILPRVQMARARMASEIASYVQNNKPIHCVDVSADYAEGCRVAHGLIAMSLRGIASTEFNKLPLEIQFSPED